MGRLATRSAFATALCTGVAMVGASVYGLVGVDASLQQSTVAVQERILEDHSLRVVAPDRDRDCPGWSKPARDQV
jgi:hypothetical protein